MALVIIPALGAPQERAPAGSPDFRGSTIVELGGAFQPALMYRKFPPDVPVLQGQTWSLSFAVMLPGMAPSLTTTLSLDPGNPHPDITVLDDTALFVLGGGLYHNYAVGERFLLHYGGTIEPWVGPIDFLLEPDGFPAIPVRVHLHAFDLPGFPLPLLPHSNTATSVGNLMGDARLEFLAFGGLGGDIALHAFDASGSPLPGWPLRNDEPDVVFFSFGPPTVVDLEDDGYDEIVVVGFAVHNPGGSTFQTTTLYVVEGSGEVRWQVTDDFEPGCAPAVADMDGDGAMDIVVGTESNLMRVGADGTPVNGWQVETLNDIHVAVPILADVDGNPRNGLEIVACTPVFGGPPQAQVYVWNQDGSLHHPSWPKLLKTCRPLTVVDLDMNPANGLEIVLAIDHDPPPVDPGSGMLNTFSVYAWHRDGSDVSGWPHDFLRPVGGGFFDDRVIAPTAAADVDGDGDIEIVVGTYGQGNPEFGNVFLFHHNGALDVHWPRWASIAQTPALLGGVALGDLDSDGQLEIVTGSFHGIFVFRADGQPYEGFPRYTRDVFAQPVIADLDADGRPEILAAALSDRVYAWSLLTPASDARPWPQYRQNPRHTGTSSPAIPFAVPVLSAAGAMVVAVLMAIIGGVLIRRGGGRTGRDSPARECPRTRGF